MLRASSYRDLIDEDMISLMMARLKADATEAHASLIRGPMVGFELGCLISCHIKVRSHPDHVIIINSD